MMNCVKVDIKGWHGEENNGKGGEAVKVKIEEDKEIDNIVVKR